MKEHSLPHFRLHFVTPLHYVTPPMAVLAAAVLLVVIVPWWQIVPLGAKLGAIFDMLVIVVMLTPVRDRLIELVR